MRYQLHVPDSVHHEIEMAAVYIARDSIEQAHHFATGAYAAMEGLIDLPNSQPPARERQTPEGLKLRQIIYKSYRVIFTVQGNTVGILRFYHTARRNWDFSDYEET